MAKQQTRHRARVTDYTPVGAPGLRLVVRLFRYEKPPEGKYRQYVVVPGRAAKLTVRNTGHLVALWERIESVVKEFAQDAENESLM